MAKVLVTEQHLTDISNAIRSKNGTATKYKPSEMANAINALSSEGGSDEMYIAMVQRTTKNANGDSITTIGTYAFTGCKNLISCDFPNVVSVGSYAFYSCSNLVSVNLPNVTSMDGNVFGNCSALEEIILPSLTQVLGGTFSSCKKLVKIDLPVATMIADYVFSYCSLLTKLILRSETVCSLSGTNSFVNTPIASGTGYIYVPDNLVEQYKVATNWVTYATQIKPLSELGE